MGTQGFRELGDLLGEPRFQIVAVCDPNTDSNDYVEWGKGGIRNTIRKYLGEPELAGRRQRLPRRPRGGQAGRRYLLRQAAGGRQVQGLHGLCRLPRTAGKGKGPRRRQGHDARPSARDRLDRGHEEGQARDDAQAAGQPHGRGPAGRRDGPQDEGGHAPAGLRRRRRQPADRRADQAGSDRHAPRDPQLDEPARVAAVHGDSHRHARRSPRGSTGTCGSARRWTAPIIRTTRTRSSAAGTISAAARWPTWASTACGRCSKRSASACPSAPRPGRPTPARSRMA